MEQLARILQPLEATFKPYSPAQINRIMQHVSGLSQRDMTSLVNSMIDGARWQPTPAQIAEAAKSFRKRGAFERKAPTQGPSLPPAPKCLKCGDRGLIVCRQKSGGFYERLFACDCKASQKAFPPLTIETYKDHEVELFAPYSPDWYEVFGFICEWVPGGSEWLLRRRISKGKWSGQLADFAPLLRDRQKIQNAIQAKKTGVHSLMDAMERLLGGTA